MAQRGSYFTGFNICCLVAIFIGAALGVWSRPSEASAEYFAGFTRLESVYAKIRTGATTSDLGRLGVGPFDDGVERLSYLALLEHYMPMDSHGFDRLPEPVQTCLNLRQRCSALVFRPGTASSNGRDAIMLFIQDGRVAYKASSGDTSSLVALK